MKSSPMRPVLTSLVALCALAAWFGAVAPAGAAQVPTAGLTGSHPSHGAAPKPPVQPAQAAPVPSTSGFTLAAIHPGFLVWVPSAQLARRGPDSGPDARTIVIENGEVLIASGTTGEAIAIDSRDEQVEVINRGTVGALMATDDEAGSAIGVAASAGDDSVWNEGLLISNSAVDRVLFLGDGVRGNSTATGVDGGAGADVLTNVGQLSVATAGTAGSGSIGIPLLDDAEVDVHSEAAATSTGFAAGAGDDEFANWGLSSTGATATAGAGAIAAIPPQGLPAPESVTVDASASSTATSVGADGGAGSDLLSNNGVGEMYVWASGIAGSGQIAVHMAGDSSGDASSSASATAIGLDGEDGIDTVTNGATLRVEARGVAGAGGIDVSVGGGSAADVSSAAGTLAVGLAGGAGDDQMTNSGGLIAMATSSAGSGSIGVSIPQSEAADSTRQEDDAAVSADAASSAAATATGLDGGAGDDTLLNAGTLLTQSSATSGSGSIGVNLSGDSQADASSNASASAIGLDGGEGDNQVTNAGTTLVSAAGIAGSGSISVGVGGASGADVSSTAAAAATGLNSGAGEDSLTNQGLLVVAATANAGSGTISLSLPEPEPEGQAKQETNEVNAGAASTAVSAATGFASGGGVDTIVNSTTGSVQLSSGASATSVSLALNITNPGDDLEASAAIGDASAAAVSAASGIAAGDGDDTIRNDGIIGIGPDGATVFESTSTAIGIAAAADIVIEAERMVADAALVDTRTFAGAAAVGIDGGAGDDEIDNAGGIDMDSYAAATAVDVGVTFTNVKKGVGASAAIVEAGSIAEASATGIDGGAGDDTITNAGLIRTAAVSSSTAVGVSIGAGFAKEGALLELALADSDTVARSTATGIDAGAGDDEVTNDGYILLRDVSANATAVSVGLTVAGAKQGVAGAASLANAAAIAEANGTGIATGDGDDKVRNNNLIGAEQAVRASATAAAATVTVGFAKEGAALGAALADSSANASATATGIDAGAGDDEIYNEGGIGLATDADATGVSVALTVTGAKEGAAFGASLADASANAEAETTGIRGGDGEDTIDNSGAIVLTADSAATAVSVGVTVAGAKAGVAGGVALTDARAMANARATGIDGGNDDDTITNSGDIGVAAVSDVAATSVSASFAVVKDGAALGAALSDTSAAATATAIAIDGGDGDDTITNGVDGDMAVRSTAEADAVSISVSVGAGGTALAAGASLADTSATAAAVARGISGGDGDDTITNEGTIDLMGPDDIGEDADADATAASISVTLTGAVTGAAAGVALTDASALAVADAAGLEGGDGDDEITNRGTIRSNTSAEATATGVSVQVGVTNTGIAGGAAIADSSAVASAATRGIDGGDGDDTITNEGDIEIVTGAGADALSLAISLTASLNGVAMGATVTDAGTTALANSEGIAGGAGEDEIVNTGSINAQSIATAQSESISVTGSLAVASGGAALADAKSHAEASATGIRGGAGDDEIRNGDENSDGSGGRVDAAGGILAVAISYSEGTSVAANIAMGGLGMGETTNTSNATATGIGADEGDDRIHSYDSVTAIAGATAEGLALTVNLAGAGMGDASSTAAASATGIDGGKGDDQIDVDGSVLAVSAAVAESDAITPGLIGVAEADASTTALASATGIDAGDGNDRVENRSSIDAWAGNPFTGTTGASTDSFAISLSLAGAGTASADSTAISTATGIGGGDGRDELINFGAINAGAYTLGESGSIDLRLGGAGNANAASTTAAWVTGIDGGAGNDEIRNAGAINLNALSVGYSKSFALTAFGAVDTNAKVTTVAGASGLSGGAGRDQIVNSGSIVSNARAEGYSVSTAVNLVGEPNARADTATRAEASGIAGGDGGDTIGNAGSISTVAESVALVQSTSFTLAGVSSSEGAITASARSAGISGGDGADTITNDGSIDVHAFTAATANASAIALLGGAQTKSGIRASAEAVGIDGTDGDSDGDEEEGDEIVNLATIEVDAVSVTLANGDAFALAGGASAQSFISAAAQATGIAGGQQADTIRNEGSIAATATTVASSGQEASVGLGGDAETLGEISAESSAAGIAAGGGGDDVTNTGSIVVTAAANGDATSDSEAGTFTGDGDATSAGDATATAIGIDLGSGESELTNAGTLTVTGQSNLSAVGLADGSNFADGNGYANAYAVAAANAYGVWAGHGDAAIHNGIDGAIDVSIVTTALGSTFADGDGAFGDGDGFAVSDAALNETPLAAGIWLGDGNHELDSAGSVSVTSTGTGTAIATADGDLVTANAFATANAAMGAMLYGVRLGEGRSETRVTGDLSIDNSVTADAYAKTNPYADADGGGYSTAGSMATTEAYGIWLGDGDQTLDLSGSLSIRSLSVSNATALSDSDTVSVSAKGVAEAGNDATFYGIRAGDGLSRIDVSGDLTIDATMATVAYANANPGGAADGGGRAEATSETTVVGCGIATGSGMSTISNGGEISVAVQANPGLSDTVHDAYAHGDGDTGRDASAESSSFSAAWGAGIYSESGSSRISNDGAVTVAALSLGSPWTLAGSDGPDGNATANSNGVAIATAEGIRVDGESNEIVNRGDVAASATAGVWSWTKADTQGTDGDGRAYADAGAVASASALRGGYGDDRIVNEGNLDAGSFADVTIRADGLAGTFAHAHGEATGTATSEAYGIRAGAGDNHVTNSGAITANAVAAVEAVAWAEDDGGVGSSERAYATALVDVLACGIQTGTGDDVIENDGSISATATGDAFAWRDTEDNAASYGTIELESSAVGISSGEGDDTITNRGTISAIQTSILPWETVTELGRAIDAGAGDDSIVLCDGSETQGHVVLGDGDDTLVFEGDAALIGFDTGRAILLPGVFGGAGIDTLMLQDVELISLDGMSGIERLWLNDGTLELHGACELAPDGLLFATINGEDSSGQLRTVGGGVTLGGTLQIEAGASVYHDGQSHVVVLADGSYGVSGAFDEVLLPRSTAFLEFSFDQFEDRFEVGVDVASFASAATSPAEQAIADALDRIAPDASGDMSQVIGSFQLAGLAQVGPAFESLGPSLYDAVSRSAADASRAYAQSLHYRMDTARTARGTRAGSSAGEGRDLGLWVQALGRWGGSEHDISYSGYDHGAKGIAVGADAVRKRYFFGGALGYLSADVELDDGLGRGDADHGMLSGYAGFMPGRGFVQTAISYGRGSYETLRDLRVGDLRREARGAYDGSLWSWSVKGGYEFALRDWSLEPFGVVSWLQSEEDPVSETGADAADLLVAGRERDGWAGSLGLRVFAGFSENRGRFHPEFLLAWNRVSDCGDCDLSIAYAGAPDVAFSVPGREDDRDSALLGAGIFYFGEKGWNAGARFNAEVRDDAVSYGVVGQFRYRF